ncbi:N6-adenosine-methyltransferase MT-A70-like [Capsicum chinense]|nr:N6-adenosine-methyltransferase MT-A70-like [Capsicum chinense]
MSVGAVVGCEWLRCVCWREFRLPAIDLLMLLRKLENDQLEDVEKVAIRELGRDLRAIVAVEMTLKLMAEDKGCVELENFVVIGKSKIKVLSIYRTRLLKEFLESKQNEGSVSEKEKMVIVDECGGPLFVRAMVVVCLLERVPFTAIDSSMALKKLENDPLEDTEKVATSELGGVLGALVAVEMALKSAAEDNGCVELENFVVSGKSRIMVLKIDGTRLLKELPESKKNDCLRGMTGIFPGNIGSPIGGHTGMVGMIEMLRGVSVPPLMSRPPMGPNGPVGGGNYIAFKPRTEEDEMKD